MTSIVIYRITGQQPAHNTGKADFRAAQKNMGMVGHQGPGIDAGLCIGSKLSEAFCKIFSIGNIVYNPAPFDSSHNHMM
jgi:hypothetical protein